MGAKIDVALLKGTTTSLKTLGEQALKNQTLEIVFPEDLDQEDEEEVSTEATEQESTANGRAPSAGHDQRKQIRPPPSIETLKENCNEVWELVQGFQKAIQKEKDNIGARREWSIPSPNDPLSRYAAHRFAEHVGIHSYSTGSGSKRIVILSNVPKLCTPELESFVPTTFLFSPPVVFFFFNGSDISL